MKKLSICILIGLQLAGTACSQDKSNKDKVVGGGCEACDLMYEGMPSTLSWTNSFAPSDEPGEPMVIHGTIYRKDGKLFH